MLRTVRRTIILASALWPAVGVAQAPAPASAPTVRPAGTPAPAGAALYFITPKNGARIRGPFVVQFGLRNMGVTPAGSTAPNAGHHHLLVDAREELSPGEPIPADKNHVHFGGGQTETRLDLAPGPHVLQLVLGDAEHRLFNPNVISDKIEITVLEDRPAPKRKRRSPRQYSY